MTTAKADQPPAGYISHKRRKGMCKADTPTALAVLTALKLYRTTLATELDRYKSQLIKHGSTHDPVGTMLAGMVNHCFQQQKAVEAVMKSVTKAAHSEPVVKAAQEWAKNYLLTIK